jgi:hypothetical protein
MDQGYHFPVILQEGKRLGLRHHVAQHSDYSVLTINRLIESGNIASHLISYQIYIDIDEALTALSNSRFQPRRRSTAANKVLSDKQKTNLFA